MSSELKRLLVVGAGLILCCGVVLFGLRARSLSARNAQNRKDLRGLQQKFKDSGFVDDDVAYEAELSRLEGYRSSLDASLNGLAAKMTFEIDPAVRPELGNPAFFKSRLQSLRIELGDKATDAGVKVLGNLGFDEAIPSEADATDSSIMLLIVAKLVELGIEARVDQMDLIEPLKPQSRTLSEGEEPFMVEYPVRLVIQAPLKALLEFLRLTQRQGSFFALERMRIEPSAVSPGGLRCTATVAGFLFPSLQREGGGEGEEPAAQEERRVEPSGF